MSHAPDHNWLKALGPGLLFAATSVGVSHLVQSTRAGASYGLSLMGVVIAANVIKYPAFRFGSEYAAATGTSLLEGYRRQGSWALWLYTLVTVSTMFTIQAVVCVVTAGLAIAALGIQLKPVVMAAALMLLCLGILGIGKYRLLDGLTKVLIVVLTLCTFVCAALVVPHIDWSQSWFPSLGQLDKKTIAFSVALAGWMPSAIDIAVWQSLWTVARRHDTQYQPPVKQALLDFHIGYIGTAIFAMCFVMMGAGVMYGSGKQMPASAVAFAAQVIALYTQTLGSWSAWFIGLCAFAVMFSTTLAVVDGFPRALTTLVLRFLGPEPETMMELNEKRSKYIYWLSALVLFVGSTLVLAYFLKSLKALVDVATTMSFLTAPILAWLNHRAVVSRHMPKDKRPGLRVLLMSQLSIVLLTAFALFYLWQRYLSA